MVRTFHSVLLAPLLLAHAALSARVTNPNKVPKNAVLLSNVESLTLRAGQQTSSRRAPAVGQLKCVGSPSVCDLYQIEVLRCTNEGSDYDKENIQWACKAQLPAEFKLGGTDVSCEGYESSDDPYVLKGSCGVEYKLLLTDQGEAKYEKLQDNKSWTNTAERSANYLFIVIFLGVLLIILLSLYRAWRDESRRPGGPRSGGWGGGGGGGGGPDDNDPPPPYDPYPRRDLPPKKPSTRSYTPRASSSRSNQQQGWRPGFWTGTAAGAAAGYAAGSRNQSTRQPDTRQTNSGGGLCGSGGGGPSTTPSYSSSRHESTGFGSTSRR